MPTEPYRTSIEIAAPPDQVYPYLTQPEAMLTWMGDYAVLDPTPGGEFTLDVNGVPVRGRYLQLDPPTGWSSPGATPAPPSSHPAPAPSRSTSSPSQAVHE